MPVAAGAQMLRSRAQMLEVEVADKKATISKLRVALSKQAERGKEVETQCRRVAEERLQQQKKDYDATLDRNLKLVDRLLGDKAELTRKCQQVTDELRALEQRTQLQLEAGDDKAAKDLQKQKANWAAAEKLRREAWEKEKVREIKEMTIKGLEPEVQRILSDHKAEKRRMEETQAQVMEAKVRELEASHAELLSAQKAQFLAELDDRLAREREWFRGKSREEYECSLKQVAEERSKAAAEHAALERAF